MVDLKREHQRALRARTLMGHVENLMGYMLSLYCIYRWGGADRQHAAGEHGMAMAWRGVARYRCIFGT